MTVQPSENDHRTVESVSKACEIVTTLEELDGAGVTEIANRLDLSKSAVHAHLATLNEKGMVVKEDDATYYLCLRFLDIGNSIREDLPIFQAARDILDDTAEISGEYVHLVVEHQGLGYHIEKVGGENAVATASRIGKAYPLNHTAPGKAIMAHLPPVRLEQVIEQHGLVQATPHSITDRDELMNELEEIRDTEIAFDRQEHVMGIKSVGAPVINTNGEVEGSVSISGPEKRMEGERFENEMPDLVKRAANYIEVTLNTQ